MASLTWRDVANPDFSSAANGFSQFSTILGNALGGLKSSVQGFDNAKSDQINNQILLALAQQPDAAAAHQAIASGQLGGLDLNSVAPRLNASVLTAISPDSMVKLGSDQNRLGQDQINASQRAEQDRQAALLYQANAGLRSADPTERSKAAELLKSFNATGVGARFVNDLNTGVQSTQSNATSNESNRTNLDHQIEDRKAADDADAAFLALKDQTLSADDARLVLSNTDANSPVSKLSTKARILLEGKFSSLYGNLNAPGAGDTSGGAGATGAAEAIAGAVGGGISGVAPTGSGNNSPYDTIVGDAGGQNKFGVKTPKPLTQMTMGEVSDFQKNVLIPANRGKVGAGADKGSGAVGAFQIVNGTLAGDGKNPGYAEKVFGKDWRSVQMTPENQDKLGEAIWNDARKGDLHDTWASLPKNDPGKYANVSWKDVRSQIAHAEVSANPTALIQDSNDASTAIATRAMQNVAHGLTIDFTKTLADGRDPGTIVDELRAGVFKGTARNFMLRQINDIMNRAHVNAATAAAVMTRNIDGADAASHASWDWRKLARQLTPGSTPNLGDGSRLNDAGIEADVKTLSSLDILKSVKAQQEIVTKSAAIDQYRALVQKTGQDLQIARQRSITQPELAKTALPRLEAAAAAAQTQLNQLIAEQARDAASKPKGTPEVTPVPVDLRKKPDLFGEKGNAAFAIQAALGSPAL